MHDSDDPFHSVCHRRVYSRRIAHVSFVAFSHPKELSHRFFSACLAFIYRIGYTLKKLTQGGGGGGVTSQEQMRKELNAVMSSNGFQLTMFSMMLAFYSRPIIIALFPICVPALYQWFTIVHKIFHSEDGKSLYTKVGMSRIFSFLQKKMHVAMSLSALMEIVILVVVVLEAVKRRSLGKMFAHLMWLRSRYQCEDNTVFRIKYTYYNTGYYHKEAWKSLNQNLFAPLTSKVPVLQRLSDRQQQHFTHNREGEVYKECNFNYFVLHVFVAGIIDVL